MKTLIAVAALLVCVPVRGEDKIYCPPEPPMADAQPNPVNVPAPGSNKRIRQRNAILIGAAVACTLTVSIKLGRERSAQPRVKVGFAVRN